MDIITHRHIHPPTVTWDSNGRWLTEMAEFTEDHWLWLARVRGGASLSGISGWYPPQKEKECMFEKEK